MKRYAHPRQLLIFLLIAIPLMIIMDMFVLKGWRPNMEYAPLAGPTVQAEIVYETQSPALSVTEEEMGSEVADMQSAAFMPTPEPVPATVPQPEKIAMAAAKDNWKDHAVKSAPIPGTGKVVIIIDDMGVDKRSRDVIAMPGPLTLAFLPYASNLQAQTSAAHKAGHELMVHVPMQPIANNVDPGPDVLKTDMTYEEFMAALGRDFDSFAGYVGINNHMGSKLTQDTKSMQWVMQALKERGLLFVDSKTIPTSVAADTAASYGLPFAARDVFLDHETTLEFARHQLHQLEIIAKQKGYAIAIGHPKDNTIAALKEWIPTLKDRGLSLVPVSAVVHRRAVQAASAKAAPLSSSVQKVRFGPPSPPHE